MLSNQYTVVAKANGDEISLFSVIPEYAIQEAKYLNSFIGKDKCIVDGKEIDEIVVYCGNNQVPYEPISYIPSETNFNIELTKGIVTDLLKGSGKIYMPMMSSNLNKIYRITFNMEKELSLTFLEQPIINIGENKYRKESLIIPLTDVKDNISIQSLKDIRIELSDRINKATKEYDYEVRNNLRHSEEIRGL